MGSDEKYSASEAYELKMYKIMAENLGEEIFVTDGDGRVLFVNPASIAFLGLPIEDIIGKTAQELVDLGCFSHSAAVDVLKTGEKVNVLQKVRDGRTVIATGVPVYDSQHERIEMVICTSKDVDAINKLLKTVEDQQEEIQNLRENVFENEGFISADPVMTDIKHTITKIAALDMPVLVTGETGVGKEVIVKAIHRFSERKDGPLYKINCGIIPDNLIETELFGYEKGSFTGAEKAGKKGKIEMADKGTLFLDEIGELPLPLQVKLLDFLQEGTIVRVGGTKEISVDARVVAATNRDLVEMCKNSSFRQDLYYRLNVIPLRIPPLRERPMDIDALTKYYIKQFNAKYGGNKQVTASFIKILHAYDWPGNVRELEHMLERIYVMSNEDILDDKNAEILLNESEKLVNGGIVCLDIMPLKDAKHEIEKQLVMKAYERYGSTYKAANALKVDQSTVAKIMKRLSTEKDTNENNHHNDENNH